MMIAQPKISIILAVYKAELYIEKCVRSLFKQTLDNLEFIFVDDCSPDKSIEVMQRILEDYPSRKAQVKIIKHSKNQGVGKTRQDGLDAATGEYIIHCDPDDWVDEDLYEKLYHKARNSKADITICDFMYEGDESTPYPQQPLDLTSESVLGSIVGTLPHWLHCSLCNKLVKTSCYESIRIPNGFDSHEDSYVLINMLSSPKQIEYVSNKYYHYRINNKSSLTKGFNSYNMEMDRKAVDAILTLQNIDISIKSAFAAKVLIRDVQSNCYTDKEFKKYYYDYHKYISSNLQAGDIIQRIFLYLSCMGYHSMYLKYYKIRKIGSKFKKNLKGVKNKFK